MAAVELALAITDLDLGGAERCLAQLAVRIDRRRFRPVVYCLGPRPGDDEASCVPMLEAAGIDVHCLGGRGAWDFPRVTRRLTEHLCTQRPQLLQTMLFHANFVGRIAARRAEVPRVVSGIRVAERHSRWHLWLDRLSRQMVDRYVCVSQSVARFSRETGHLPGELLEVIPNGVDFDRFPASKPADLTVFGLPAGQRAVTFVGRLTPQKGLAWLLKTADRWLGRVPDCDLLLVGHGPERKRLERLAGRLGLTPRVHFAGWQPQVPEILAASALLLLPSAWEGMPNVVLEAMASRLPVVASRVEGVEELLGPESPRQTVSFGDEAALPERITNFLQNTPLAEEVGARNRRRVEESFSLDHMAEAYQQLWTALL